MDPTRKITDPIEKISVARKMYLAGFALLPWMWMVNYLMFRRDLLKPTVPHELKVCTFKGPIFGRMCTILYIFVIKSLNQHHRNSY
jgi:hypothetical protein